MITYEKLRANYGIHSFIVQASFGTREINSEEQIRSEIFLMACPS